MVNVGKYTSPIDGMDYVVFPNMVILKDDVVPYPLKKTQLGLAMGCQMVAERYCNQNPCNLSWNPD